MMSPTPKKMPFQNKHMLLFCDDLILFAFYGDGKVRCKLDRCLRR